MNASDWPQYSYRGVLKRVVDGDTVVATLDLGLRVFTDVALRLAGIDAPEINRGEPEERALGRRARNFVERYEGRGVCVRTYRDKRSFNRYVADILLIEQDGELQDLAGVIVEAGHAVRV